MSGIPSAFALAVVAACAAFASPGCHAPAALDLPPRADNPAGTGALVVGFLVVDGVYNSELTAPYDIFHHVPYHALPGMEVLTVGPDRTPIETFEGLHIIPDYGYDDAPPLDVLVVPSAEHSMDSDLDDEALLAYVRLAGGRAEVVLSLCDGAFVLAAAGLLDGLASTTFPSDVEAYRRRFPHLDVRDGVSFVHDGKAITSVGGAPSFEAALYLVERLYGAKIARGVAAGLVIDWDLDDPGTLVMPALVMPGARSPPVDWKPVPRD